MSEFDLLARLGAGEAAIGRAICSRAGCTAPATHRIEWRNPRIHREERIKIWLSCGEHLGFLSAFLRDRSMPLRVREMSDDTDEEPIG